MRNLDHSEFERGRGNACSAEVPTRSINSCSSPVVNNFAVQLSLSLARDNKQGRRAVGHGNDGEDIPGAAFGYFESQGLWYWCEERYGYAAGYPPLDVWKVRRLKYLFVVVTS